MSKLNQTKIPLGFSVVTWKLVRESDGLVRIANDVMWLEWKEDRTFKSKHDEPSIGRGLIMSPFNDFFTWQTTPITEIIEQTDTYLKFKTENSVYELFKL